jgi:multiple sugar transport system permease protein
MMVRPEAGTGYVLAGLYATRGRVARWIGIPFLVLLASEAAKDAVVDFLLSLTDFDVYAIARLDRLRLVGFANYRTLLTDARFWGAVRNTAYFVLVGGPLSIALSLGAAVLLDARAVRWKPFFRTVLFLPVVTTLVAVAIVWRAIYHPRAGLLAWLCTQLGIAPVDWLGDPVWAMPAIILMAVWKGFGFNMLVFVAGLQSVPERLYEAARLDGADAWQRFRYVTLPVLAPTFGFVAVTTTIGYLQLFAEPQVLSAISNNVSSSYTPVLYAYTTAFNNNNYYYAAALSVVLAVITCIFSFSVLRVTQRQSGV